MADYCTAAEVKTRIEISGSSYDTLLGVLVTAASRLVDRYVRKWDDYFDASATASARVFDGSGGTVQWIDECTAVTTVEVKDGASDTTYQTWASTDYVTWPYNETPIQRLDVDESSQGTRSSFTQGQKTVQVTAKWGYSDTAPATVAEATSIIAARLFKRAQAGYNDVEGVAEVGVLRYVRELAPEAALILDLFRQTGKRVTAV